MYTLYFAPGSASMVVHLALLEIGLPYRLEKVDLEKDEQRSPAYLRINPRGQVPTLIVDGRPQYESAALLMLLAERHPEAGLAPAPGEPGRADWYQWVVFMANSLAPPFRYWFMPGDLGSPELPSSLRDALRQRIELAWTQLDAQLEAGGPYLLGDRFSGADLYATMLMRWSRNMPRPATEWPSLRRLAERVRARPSWARLYEIEGLTEWRV